MVVTVNYWNSGFSLKASLRTLPFGIHISSPTANIQIPFPQLWTQTCFLLISGARDTLQTLNMQCLFYPGNLQRWTKVKSMVPPDFVKVWIYVQAEELEFYSCSWVLVCIWPMYVLEADLKLRQAETRDSTGWTSLKMLFGIERVTCSLERSPTCFLLKKSSLLKEEPGLVTSRYILFFKKFDIWMYGKRIFISAQRPQGVCCCSYCYSTKFYLFMILLHHTAEFWPPGVVWKTIAFHLWPSLPKIQFFAFNIPLIACSLFPCSF